MENLNKNDEILFVFLSLDMVPIGIQLQFGSTTFHKAGTNNRDKDWKSLTLQQARV